MGLSLACKLAQRGAHISIVSRSQSKLDKALIEIEVRSNSTDEKQRLTRSLISLSFSFHVDTSSKRFPNLPCLLLRSHLPFLRLFDTPSCVSSAPLLPSLTRLHFRLCGRLRPRSLHLNVRRRTLGMYGMEFPDLLEYDS